VLEANAVLQTNATMDITVPRMGNVRSKLAKEVVATQPQQEIQINAVTWELALYKELVLLLILCQLETIAIIPIHLTIHQIQIVEVECTALQMENVQITLPLHNFAKLTPIAPVDSVLATLILVINIFASHRCLYLRVVRILTVLLPPVQKNISAMVLFPMILILARQKIVVMKATVLLTVSYKQVILIFLVRVVLELLQSLAQDRRLCRFL